MRVSALPEGSPALLGANWRLLLFISYYYKYLIINNNLSLPWHQAARPKNIAHEYTRTLITLGRNSLKPPRQLLTPFLLMAIGIGVSGWYGLELYELPRYSEADIDASVEANLALDLARMAPHLKSEPGSVERLRTRVREEIRTEIRNERGAPLNGLIAGLICAAFGIVSLKLLRSS